jgi:Sigma-70 region 2
VACYDAAYIQFMADTVPDPQSVLTLSRGGRDARSSVELLLRAQDGDEAARDELCARYLPRLRRWAHSRLPVWAREHLDTDDIVQDTLMRSVRQLEGFTPHHERRPSSPSRPRTAPPASA